MSKVGSYKGVKWTYQPMRDFFIFGGKTKYYFTLNSKNELTGDCFKTLKELETWVDDMAPADRAWLIPDSAGS